MKLPRPLKSRSRGRRESDAALAFLSRLAGEISIVLSLHDLLDHVIGTCRVELGFDSCTLALVDEDERDALRIRAASGLRSTYTEFKFPPGKGVHGEVLKTGRPVLIPDMIADPRVYRTQDNIGSGIYAPLVVRNRVVGVLAAYRSARDAFTPAELDLLTVVAGYAASAVEVARLHESLKEQALNSSHQLAEALDVVSVAMIIASLADGTILRWNRAAGDVYGYTREEVVGHPVTLLDPPDHAGMLDGILAAVSRGEQVRSVDAVHVGTGGLRRHVTLSAHPMRNAAGKVRWVLLDVVGR
jgi:PAS domain S-box-containing protein